MNDLYSALYRNWDILYNISDMDEEPARGCNNPDESSLQMVRGIICNIALVP